MNRLILAALVLPLAPLAARAEEPRVMGEAPVRPEVELGLVSAPGLTANPDLADAPDEPMIEEEIEEQSQEMEELLQAEERAKLTEPLGPEDAAARAASRLGLESPLRLRLRDAFGRDAPGPEAPGALGAIALLPEIDHDLAKLQAEYDIPIDINREVVAYIRFFQSEPARSHFLRWLGRSRKYIPRYQAILREKGMPEDTVFLAMIESGFANYAYSRARASGPWQFITATGKRMGLGVDFWVDERRDPEKSARAASKYLKELYEQTGDWRLAWAGYNAGVGKIYKAQRRGQADFWSMTKGKVLRKETKGYVPKLMAAAIVTKHPQAFGFKDEEIQAEEWMDYETVEIPEATELAAIAKALDLPEQTLIDLNPELRRSCTPPRTFQLKVPVGLQQKFGEAWPSITADAKLAFAHHRVQRGDSMVAIASGYGVPAATIVKMNGLKSGRRLKPGTELVIPLSQLARKKGSAPADEQVARARIQEYQTRNPSSVEKEPAPKKVAAAPRIESVDGKTKAVVQVQQGDSLWGIAQKYGVGVAEICKWNNIRNSRRGRLQVGQELVVFPRNGEPGAPAANPTAESAATPPG